MPNEQQKFLEEVQEEGVDLFEQPLTETPKEEEEIPEEIPEDVKNRRHKRLERKIEEERLANIALNERLKAITESQSTREDKDYLKSLERVFGTETPEAREATEIFKEAFKQASEQAKAEALETIRQETEQREKAIKEEESYLDSMVEDLEDNLGITISPEKQKGFFKMLEKFSPKDEEGNIISYADPEAVWEIYQSRTKPNPAKDLSGRSMAQGTRPSNVDTQADAAERWLKENGII